MEYWLWDKFSLLIQINGQTSPYDTGIKVLDDYALQTPFGIKYCLLRDVIWQVSFTEYIGEITVTDSTVHTGIVFSY